MSDEGKVQAFKIFLSTALVIGETNKLILEPWGPLIIDGKRTESFSTFRDECRNWLMAAE